MNQNPLSLQNYNAAPITQKVIAASSIIVDYVLVGSIFSLPVVMVIIISTLDQPIQFSWDGINDAFPVLARATIVLDLKSDGSPLPSYYAPYVKRIGTPTTGSLYVGGFTV